MMRRRAGCAIRSHKQAGDVWNGGELYHLQGSWRVHGLHLHISEGAPAHTNQPVVCYCCFRDHKHAFILLFSALQANTRLVSRE